MIAASHRLNFRTATAKPCLVCGLAIGEEVTVSTRPDVPGSNTRPLLFDAHAHLVADDQQRYPRNPTPRPPGAPPRPPGVVGLPGGKHGPEPINEVPDALRMLRWMEEEHVDGMVAVQKRMTYQYDNSYILDSSDAYPDRMAAVVILDAESDDAADLIRSYIRNHDLAGLRLFGGRTEAGDMPWLNSPRAHKAWMAVDEAGLVMNVEVLARGGGGPSIPAIIGLAKSYSNSRVVLDHLLEPEVFKDDPDFGMDERYASLAGCRNIFFKFTSINLDLYREADIAAEDVLRRAVDLFGADHIMWGSDIGTSSGTYHDMVSRMIAATAKLTETERHAVLHDTGRAVFVKGGIRRS
jgi:predicted TIM-barrel fold metal-dependent hydrolase